MAAMGSQGTTGGRSAETAYIYNTVVYRSVSDKFVVGLFVGAMGGG